MVTACCIIGRLRAIHDRRDAQLAPHFSHDVAGRAVDGLDQQAAEQQRQGAANQQTDKDGGIGQVDHPFKSHRNVRPG